MNTFRKDLELALRLEEAVAKRYESFNYKVNRAPDTRFAPYDLEVVDRNNVSTFIEVKQDKVAGRSGNLCVEYCKASGEDSGITCGNPSDTIIYFIVFKGVNSYIKTTKGELRNYCVKNHHSIVMSYEGSSYNYLVRLDNNFQKRFQILPLPEGFNY